MVTLAIPSTDKGGVPPLSNAVESALVPVTALMEILEAIPVVASLISRLLPFTRAWIFSGVAELVLALLIKSAISCNLVTVDEFKVMGMVPPGVGLELARVKLKVVGLAAKSMGAASIPAVAPKVPKFVVVTVATFNPCLGTPTAEPLEIKLVPELSNTFWFASKLNDELTAVV